MELVVFSPRLLQFLSKGLMKIHLNENDSFPEFQFLKGYSSYIPEI